MKLRNDPAERLHRAEGGRIDPPPASAHAFSQQVLRTDVAGMPLEWID